MPPRSLRPSVRTGPYNHHVLGSMATGRIYSEIYSWVQRQLRKTSDIDADGTNSKNGYVTAALVRMDGSTLRRSTRTAVGGPYRFALSDEPEQHQPSRTAPRRIGRTRYPLAWNRNSTAT